MDKPIISNNIIYILIGNNNEEYEDNYTWICYASKDKNKIEQAKKENEKWAKRIEKEYFPKNYKEVKNRINLISTIDYGKLREDKSTAPYDPETSPVDILLKYRPVAWFIEEIKEII